MDAHALSHLPRTSDLTDEQLVAHVLDGDTRLFAAIVRRYNQRLYRVARSITRDEHEAEDVVQQTFLFAFQKLSQFAGRAQFSTWLTRITVNEALARVRRRKRAGELELSELRQPAATTKTPEDAVALREATRLLENAIDELAPNARLVLMMRDIEEMSTAETAAVLDISDEAVRVRLHRARASLREALLARVGAADGKAFSFAGARCDRIVAAVFAALPSGGAAR